MKKILVVCDEYAYKYQGNFYLRDFDKQLFSRYLNIFDCVRFAVRTREVTSKRELGIYNNIVDNSKMEIYPISFFQGPTQYLSSYFKVRQQLNRSIIGCDGAILRIPSTIAFACLKSIRKHGLPYIVEVVANPKELAQISDKPHVKFVLSLMHLQQMRACKEAHGASYVTRHALQKTYPIMRHDSFESYYSSVDLSDEFYTNRRDFPNIDDTQPFVICHVSHPIKTLNKGHLTFFNIIHELKSRGYNVIGKVAGDGDLVPFFKEELKRLDIVNQVEFLGLLDSKELKKLLIYSDMMIFPTESEGLPRVVIEAMATGLPCLSTSVGGIPELLNEQYLFAPNDIEGYVNKFQEIYHDKIKYISFSNEVFEKSKEYSSSILTKRRNDFYSIFKMKL